MSLIVAAVAAAGVALAAGGVGLGTWLRRRSRRSAPAAPIPSPAPRDPASDLVLHLGDVVQVEMETRWLSRGILAREGSALRCAVFYAEEGASEQPVVCLAQPDRHIYWLGAAQQGPLPPQPPNRLEIEGRLVERIATFPAELETVGSPTTAFGPQGVITIYEGGVGDAAITLHGPTRTALYYGRRLDESDYDRLGTVGVAPEGEAPEAVAPDR